ncbi:transposase [Klebsiella pneumoniae]|uniref:transposase n=1 Tax=Klebsiella pneumoniae TaxID=573 RepID=UPI0032AF053B
MEQILPWQNMVEVIEPFYPKAGNGRRLSLETMLRIHCMQHWYNLSDGAMWKMPCTKSPPCACLLISLDSALPDRTTIAEFPPPARAASLARQLFKTINRWLAEAGVMMTQKALWWMPPSLRHPALPRTKSSNAIRRCIRPEGNQWHFGMKAHIGVDARVALTHSPSHHRGQRA